MSKTRVVDLHKEAYDVYIGRGSKWGNPDGKRVIPQRGEKAHGQTA